MKTLKTKSGKVHYDEKHRQFLVDEADTIDIVELSVTENGNKDRRIIEALARRMQCSADRLWKLTRFGDDKT